MSDEKLSGEEKRRQMKEQFKNDLRQNLSFVEKMKKLQREQKILKALGNMKVEDDSDEWIRKLNEESAFHDAKMEMALESANEKNNIQVSEEEMQKVVAEEMVKKLKAEMNQSQISAVPPKEESNPNEEKPPRNMLG